MTYFLITFAVFLVIIAAMSVGYIIQRKTISGSCGGIAALGLEKVCDCPEPCEKRKAKIAKEQRIAQIREENRII